MSKDPRAIALGRALFFDPRFSQNNKVSCSSCHPADLGFRDRLQRSRGIGLTKRRTLGLIGAAYSPWQFWDGRKDSLWSQALSPLESAVEHGGSRTDVVREVASSPYRVRYESLFDQLPDAIADPDRFRPTATPLGGPDARRAWRAMRQSDRREVNKAFANVGKAIGAFVSQIVPQRTSFDDYVDQLGTATEPPKHDTPIRQISLTATQIRGLRLFLGKAQCVTCHNGPMFSNFSFHNTGVHFPNGLFVDNGRRAGAFAVQQDPFNCVGRYSDADPATDCAELRFIPSGPELNGSFKTASLRGIAHSGPYTHTGQFRSLRDVLDHYNRAPAALIGQSELSPLRLKTDELTDIEAFLHALTPQPTDDKGR